jgi:hypothetical protein
MLHKIRFIEPGNYSPYKKSIANVLTYNKYIRNPSTGHCSVIQHFGRTIRKRTPQNIVMDIKTAIAFHRRKIIPRLNKVVWI